MTNIQTKLDAVGKDIKSTKKQQVAKLAEVVETSDYGAKIRIYGEEAPRETFYNALAIVAPGDTVYIDYVADTVLIMGKLMYKKR